MTERKVIRAKKQNIAGQQREKTEGEKRFATAILKMKDNGTIKPKGQPDGSNVKAGKEEPPANPHTVSVQMAQATSKQERRVVHIPSASGKKKENFEDKHNRVTTYISKQNHEKLKWVRKEYGIPLSETLNKALEEYFQKYYK